MGVVIPIDQKTKAEVINHVRNNTKIVVAHGNYSKITRRFIWPSKTMLIKSPSVDLTGKISTVPTRGHTSQRH